MSTSLVSLGAAALAGLFAWNANPTAACTRFVYRGADNDLISAWSMDWKPDREAPPFRFLGLPGAQ
ncbi:hypothetical protein LJR219_001626 [Phenylobacterium sp. LjRoot219]|uniref:hypothetical protein n=1 Tax=Phenylobacterium sp. LjRoot219 TaxID=3342283 RepID=UPI003ECE0DEF